MLYLLGGITILICIFLVGYFTKKKYYRETDRLEVWKIDITNRPVLDELHKVKQLNMNGETEERFERWRNTWDEIVTSKLPDLDLHLFNAEEQIDKYRFKKAKEIQQEISEVLEKIEHEITELINELQELVGSEEKNRSDIDQLKDILRDCKKLLLAQRFSFGKTEVHLESRLEDVSLKFKQYDEHTANGNYLSARQIVLEIKAILEKTKNDMDQIPNLLIECRSTIPSQINDLKEGYKEMLAQGYILTHIHVDKDCERINQEVEESLKTIEEECNIEVAQEKISEWKETIDTLYDLLEKEVLAKHELTQTDRDILAMLQSAKEYNSVLHDELVQIRSSYHLEESDKEILDNLAKRLDQLFNRFDLIENKLNENNTAYTYLREELESIKNVLEVISTEQSAFGEKLQALRKDEITARNQIVELKKKIASTVRHISKSNIPGIPEDYKYLMEDAQEDIQQVVEKLNEKPLDIPIVQELMDVAVLAVDKVTNRTEDLLEMVQLVEMVIQYGNRYRSKSSTLDRDLKEAEQRFREFDYNEALEMAAAAIEKIEPGSLKKVEKLIENQ